ncbi:thermonuclease family protein [Martelella alba]|uniref:Thermonuclease family protein n=1 Tax=Martelella alba TaxID=2590451 RepID=A0A506UDB5_9HYPH|nr:thermonuclease family protein [Martelella alba]TPW31121.1 thermonuclease family protein [Martelella alba]
MKRLSLIPLLVFPVLAAAESVSAAQDVFSGPVRAEVVRIVDGDTILVHARPWPGQIIETYVRLRGIDTPELHSSCADERRAAGEARDMVASLVHDGDEVELEKISGDKYFGRVVADVTLTDRSNLSSTLLLKGLAVSYDGGRKTPYPCPGS